MDALLLMAPMVTAMGYEGTGDFMMDVGRARFRGCRRAAFRLSPIPACRSSIRACSTTRRAAASRPICLWDRAIEKERLFGVRLDGVWIHVGTPEAVAEAEEYLADLAPAV